MEEIEINHLTKIEGHANLRVRFDRRKKKVNVCTLNVFESPRYFEALIKGRNYKEVPYLASRICGICNVAHLIGSTLAVEDALGIETKKQTKLLRELLVLSGIFHSHALQLYFLALPDYLGCSSALDMKEEYIKRCLKLKEVGNDIVNVIGGRSIHPLTPVVGGFTKLPKQDNLKVLVKKLKKVKKEAIETVKLFKSLKTPNFEFKTDFLALKKYGFYPFLNGDVTSLSGLCFKPKNYQSYLKEKVVGHSSSKHITLNGKSFIVGPLARINLHADFLSKDASDNLDLPCFNIFSSNLARAVEIVHCIDRCIEILEKLEIKKDRIIKPKFKGGEGVSATEAPRGMLFHHYKFNKEGKVTSVNIIPPTTQNVKSMEDSIRQILPSIMNLSKKKIIMELEKLIRAYDPCLSCSTHFLELEFV